MTVLLVDIGNTRVKWARLTASREPGRMRAGQHLGWDAARFRAELFPARLPPGRVLVVSVAGAAVERKFRQAVRDAGWGAPQFLRSAPAAGGVRNGYREAWRLGADRWAALLGARALCGDGAAACVVDVGTAVTIDLLRGDGRHLGGAIVPGPELMVASLLGSTGGIRRRAQAPPGDPPGRRAAAGDLYARATAQALQAGALHAVAAVIERAAAQAPARLGRVPMAQGPRLLLTGGGAPQVRRLLRIPYELVPDLVLRGLAAVA